MKTEQDNFASTLIMDASSFESNSILVVDDEELICNLMTDALQIKHYFVDSALDAQSAIKMMSETYYNIILIDINLPDMTGRELFMYCKEHTPRSAVIIITGAPDLNDAVAMMKDGVFDYLSKPIDLQKLYTRIDNVIKRRTSIELESDIAKIIHDIPPEYTVTKIISMTEASIILLVEKEAKYYAMKILKYDTIDESTFKDLKRFKREAAVMKSISHPNIVTVYEYKLHKDKLPYILTEYVPTFNITKELLNEMNFKEKISIIQKLAKALWEVHQQGIIHRDIKPSNIMLASNGEPKLTDFGIARIKDSSLTLTKEILGSPRYMAPEAFEAAHNLDARSDIFSLGLVAYEFITGERAFDGHSIRQITQSICTEKAIKPSERNPKIPKDVDQILARMLAKDPGDRYSDIAMVATDIGLMLDGKVIKNRSSGLFKGMLKGILEGRVKADDVWA